MVLVTAQDELEKFLDRKGALFADAVLNLARSKAMGHIAHEKALFDMASLIRKTLQLTNMHGRKRTLLEADRVTSRARFSEIPADANPLGSLPFEEAVDDMISREPRLASGWEEVSRIYTQDHGFALARSADLKITKRVQEEIGKLMAEGKSTQDVENAILDIGNSADMGAVRDWDRAYAATVYRTNASTGYNAGRIQQAQDPDIHEVVPALEYAALMDDRTRPWHAAAHGFIADTYDPLWKSLKPPIGWQCRCAANFISKYELERRGLLDEKNHVRRYLPPNFRNAHPDPGFRPGALEF